MNTRLAGVTLITVCWLAEPANSQSDIQDYNLTGLKCAPVSLLIGLDEEAAKLGLTEQILRDAAEARLRPARLVANSDDTSGPDLHLDVDLLQTRTGYVFMKSVRLKDWVAVNSGQMLGMLMEALVADPRLSRDARLSTVDTALQETKHAYATLWARQSFGTIGNRDEDGQFILNGLNQEVDAFVATYLRMSDDDCQ